MSLAAFLAALPLLYWPHPTETAEALRRAGIARLGVPREEAAAWRRAGFAAVPLGERDLAARVKLPAPGLLARADVASATLRPWVFANGWRFRREPEARYLYELPAGKAALGAAEAFAGGVDAVLAIEPADLGDLGRMLGFLGELPSEELPPVADLAVVDDGSALVGEVMNLLARRNLLFRVVRAPAADLPVNVELGTDDYPKADAADPDGLALAVRRRLGDDRRSLRLFGSEVVLGRLAGDAGRVRLHLVNYGGRDLQGLRVRLRGSWGPGEARVAGRGRVAVEDHRVREGTTEFSLPEMGIHAMVELPALR